MTPRRPLEEIIAELLRVDVRLMTPNAGPETLGEWTSLAHLNILAAVEEMFDVTFTTAEMQEVGSLDQLRALLIAHGARPARPMHPTNE